MGFEEFLARVIDDGLAQARRDYAHCPEKRRGAVAGFAACRDLDAIELRRLLARSRERVAAARAQVPLSEYWEARCYAAEVEWVCNVVSAALHNERLPTIIPPTARGLLKAHAILGTAEARA
jgi:hypothetical protein